MIILRLLVLAALATPLLGDLASYRVTYDRSPRLHVTAELPAGDGRLRVGTGGGIDHLPDEWATFVRDLRVTTADGAAVKAIPAGKEGWRIDTSAPVRVSYDVELSYASGKWPAGNEQAGRQFEHALFTITKPLFVYTSGVTESRVDFELPGGATVATPWTKRSATSFSVPSVDSLTGNSIVLGAFATATLRVGAFDAIVATPGTTPTPPLLVQALKETGSVAASLFPQTPSGVYLMTFFREDTEDGEAYESSAAFTSPDPFDASGMLITGNTLAHELLHYWIGHKIAPADAAALAWFTEGFTEYYANVALARSGTVGFDAVLTKLSNKVTGYLYFMSSSLFSGVTLADAGKRKGAHRLGVYNGGWAVALSIDTTLRAESGGKRSLDDVLRLLFTRHGLKGTKIAPADVAAAVSEVSGRDWTPWFKQYVETREELPLAATLASLGLELRGQPYAAEMYVLRAAQTTPAQVRMREAIFGSAR